MSKGKKRQCECVDCPVKKKNENLEKELDRVSDREWERNKREMESNGQK